MFCKSVNGKSQIKDKWLGSIAEQFNLGNIGINLTLKERGRVMCKNCLSFMLVFVLLFSGSVYGDLVGRWELNGNAMDLSSYGNNGAISGNVTATTDRNGTPSSAMSFGGLSGDYIDVGDHPEFNITGEITLMAWCWLDSSSSNAGRIVSKQAASGARSWCLNTEWDFYEITTPPVMWIATNASTVVDIYDPATLPLNQWFHLAGVYTPGVSMELYLNGVLVETKTSGVSASQFSDNGYSVLIGNRHAASTCGWKGSLDDVRIYDEALSAVEIAAIGAGTPVVKANTPSPEDTAIGVGINDDLSWSAGADAVSHDVYFGTSESAVTAASRLAGDVNGNGSVGIDDFTILTQQWLGTPVEPYADLDGDAEVNLEDFAVISADWLDSADPVYKGNQAGVTFDPGTMDEGKTYYWRIDEVNSYGTTTGSVWSFTTRLAAALWEYQEWSVENPTWSDNPYDLVATVTFTHTSSSTTHTTEMFYDGGNIWKFRFTGTKTGEWTYVSSSSDSELNGLTGSINIPVNPDPDARGFLTNQGNKYAIQVGNSGELKGCLFNVYMNMQDFAYINNLTSATTINAYINDAKQYNFDTIFVHVCNNWFDFGSLRWDEHSSEDPDRQTFEALEQVILIARSRGMRVQIWAWGDEERRWTPIGVGGINGIPDQRLQRYIAARLGALPGWTMGYGFDLQEWVSETQTGVWALYLHQHFGWQHMVWGRGRTNSELDVVSYSGTSDGGQPFSYDDAVSKLNSDLTRPHLYGERFSYMRDGAWTMDNTRRAIWHYSLAGGIGGWWGFFSLGVAGSPLPPYPNPEQLATVNQFWVGRFLLDMERANTLTDGYCLKTTTNNNYVFYKENTGSVEMDLSGMTAASAAVAVDTKLSYVEIDLGTLSSANHTWSAPYVSDWAIAVGDFD